MDRRLFVRTLRKNMTEAEQLLWRHLRDHRLCGGKFRRQEPLGPYVVDFVHLGARLVVEADGGQHADSPHDVERDAWLKAAGFRVLRFWNHEVLGQTEAVLEVILRELQATPSPPAPLPRGERGAKAGPA